MFWGEFVVQEKRQAYPGKQKQGSKDEGCGVESVGGLSAGTDNPNSSNKTFLYSRF